MNKKLNTTLFIIGASLFNIVLMLCLFLLCLALLGLVLNENTSGNTAQFFLLLAFLLSVGGSYGIYSLVVKFMTNRFDMEQYFHPIFRPRSRKK